MWPVAQNATIEAPRISAMKFAAILLLVPLTTSAQVNRCAGSDGVVTFTKLPCSPVGKAIGSDFPRPSPPPSSRKVAMAEPEKSPEERLQTIRRMLATGRLSQARQYARTDQERALVREADRGHAPERKARRMARRQG